MMPPYCGVLLEFFDICLKNLNSLALAVLSDITVRVKIDNR